MVGEDKHKGRQLLLTGSVITKRNCNNHNFIQEKYTCKHKSRMDIMLLAFVI